MTAKHKELLARFETRNKELKGFFAEKGDNITDVDLAHGEKIRDDLKSIKTDIDRCVATENLRGEGAEFDRYMNEPATRHSHRGEAEVVASKESGHSEFRGSNRKGRGSKMMRLLNSTGPGLFGKEVFEGISTREYRDAFNAYIVGRARPHHYRTLEVGIDPQGGFLAPTENLARLIEKKPTPTRVSGLVDTINVGRDSISLPRVNYTSAADDPTGQIYTTGFRVTLVDENPTSATQSNVVDTNLFGSVRVANFTWMIQAPLTNNMIEDAMFDPLTWVAGKFSQTVELLKDNKIINGTGASEPSGVLANPGGSDTLTWPPYTATGTAAAPFITPDSLVTLTEQIPEQYDDNVRYLYSKQKTGPTIRTMKDGVGRFMFGDGYQDSGMAVSRARMLNGYPVIWSGFMPAPAANAFPVIAGDFSGITLVNRVGYSVQVLREIAAQKNQVIILGRVRFGCQLLEPWKIQVLKCSAS